MPFQKKALPIIAFGFRNGNQNQTKMNNAIYLNVREAITGIYPNLATDPGALIVSIGDLE
jgi:hypothetical protein